MAFSKKPEIDSSKAKSFVEREDIAPSPKEEKKAEKIAPYILRFPSAQDKQDTKIAAAKAGKTMKDYILDLIIIENKKFLN